MKDALKPLILTQELIDGSARLAEDKLLRQSFTNYIKSGSWLDKLVQLVPDSHFTKLGMVQRENDLNSLLRDYNLDRDKLNSIESSGKSDRSLLVHIANSPTMSSSSKSYKGDVHCESYLNEQVASFPSEDLLIILFTVVFPMYLASHEHKRFTEFGIEHGLSSQIEDDSSCTHGNQDSRLIQTTPSKRAQELFLGCAAFHDETWLLDYLTEPSWVHRVCSIFHDHPLPLSIVDTTKSNMPMVYVNKAFCSLTGHTEANLLGSNLSILSGNLTEATQLKMLNSKMRSNETAKLFITFHTKQQKPFFDLIAQRNVGGFSIGTHFVKSKSTQLDMLHVSFFYCLFYMLVD